jgi:alkylated DNA repair dioxygenase AlkB
MNLLFEIEEEALPNILGLAYIPDFITRVEESALIAEIDAQPWLNDLKRRVQHYGYKYDYKMRGVTSEAYLGPLPDWLTQIAQRLQSEHLFQAVPNQAIVNEYLPGQGISAHIDCVPCFGNVIASLSLGSPVIMQFTNLQTSGRQDIFLKERSLLILSGPARYEWQHAIPARKSDTLGGFKVARKRRVSLTFRNVLT